MTDPTPVPSNDPARAANWRHIRQDLAVLRYSGAFKEFEGEPWIERLDAMLAEDPTPPAPACPDAHMPPIAEGWKLVPVEPTQKMLDAVTAADKMEPFSDATMRGVWIEMIDNVPAAPTPANPAAVLTESDEITIRHIRVAAGGMPVDCPERSDIFALLRIIRRLTEGAKP